MNYFDYINITLIIINLCIFAKLMLDIKQLSKKKKELKQSLNVIYGKLKVPPFQ